MNKEELTKAVTLLLKENEALRKIDLKSIKQEYKKKVKDRITRNETLILDYTFRMKNL